MGIRQTRIAACIAVVIASALLFADVTHAQADCMQVMNQGLNSVRAFDEEAKKQSLDFAIDTTADAALGDARKILADHTIPSQASALQMELHKTKLETWEAAQKTFGVTIEELYACMKPGSACSLQDFVKRQNQAFQRWMQTFSSESTQGARDRVEKARELLQNNVKRLAGNATGSIRAAVGCMDQHIKAGSSAEPVDARARNTGGADVVKAPPPDGGGLSGGTKALIVLGVVGGAAYLAKDPIAQLLNRGGGGCSGAKPDVSACYSGNGGAGNGPGCQTALAALDQYCASCNQKRGTYGTATDCVAK